MKDLKTYNKSFEKPDEIRQFKSKGRLEVLFFEDGSSIGHGIFEPGWKWSNDVKPLAQTESCEASHTGYCVKGEMRIRMNDGGEFTIKAGDAFRIPPGHDAWVEGSVGCELIDVTGFAEYAKPVEKPAEKKEAA
ncbi:MAG: cupin domain-containing protein [Oligoflexia bacterium]|nr:cupin domain-containing protein [Oligoflexia bacterium]